MKEQVQTYLLGFVTILTVVNTVLILTNDGGGRVIQPTGTAGVQADDGAVASTSLNRNDYTQNAQEILQDPANFSQPEAAPAGPTTVVAFNESQFDFGAVQQDTKNEHVFAFTNTGSEPLIISNAKGSCGCTVPEYPKEPIAPGESGEITVVYSPGKQVGAQTKTVTVTANTDPPTTKLQIRAMVEQI